MNREIEFRIWADNQFYYKCLVGNTNNTTDNNWTCPMIWLEDKKEWVNCDNGIISQYTGLKDKNGKKIFEGDILKQQRYQKNKPYGNSYTIVSWRKVKNGIGFNVSKTENWEVIGNIYENNLESKGE